MDKVVPLFPYEVYEFTWGSAIKKKKGEWEKIFLKPDGKEIDVSNMNIILHDNGIEFL